MALVFDGKPNIGAPKKIKPTVNSVKFGNGYELRVGNQINMMPKTWSVVFTETYPRHEAQVAVLEACAGVDYFMWTDPRGVTSKYICREWESKQADPGVYELSGDFEEVFDL